MKKGTEGTGASWKWGLLPALVAGLAMRTWYYLDLSRQPFFGYPIVDSLTYDRLATALSAGGGGEVFFRPPLYPYFLSVIYALGGYDQAVAVWAQFILGLAAIVPVYLLAQRLYGSRTAALAAWIVALYPLRIFFEGEILAVTLFGFFMAWGTWFFWAGIDGLSHRRLLGAGIILGLAVLARPNFLLVVPFLTLGALLALRPRRAFMWSGTAVMLAGLVLSIAPAAFHNWEAEGRFVAVAANGGVNFYLGNRRGSSGETPLPPGLRWQHVVQEPIRLGKVTLSEQDRYWWRRGWEEIGNDPGGWAALMARKAALFWNAHESSNNKNLSFFSRHSLPVRYYHWWFGVLACLAVAGLAVCRTGPGPMFLWSLAIGYSLSVILFFITARYRLPLVPFLAVLAAAALVETLRSIRRRDVRNVLLLLLSGGLAAILVFPYCYRPGGVSIDAHFQMGQVFLSRGEPRKALEHLMRARDRAADDVDVANSIGAAWFALGDWNAAEREYLEALKQGKFSEVYFNLGMVYEKMGPSRYRDALAAYCYSLEINPLEARARANLEFLAAHPPW